MKSKFLLLLFIPQLALASLYHSGYKPGEVLVEFNESFALQLAETKTVLKISENVFRLIYPEEINVREKIRELKKLPSVKYAQPNYILSLFPDKEKQPVFRMIFDFFYSPFPLTAFNDIPALDRPPLEPAPSEIDPPILDPELSKLWGLEKAGVSKAWNIHKGSKSFIAAVIDTGIDYNHKDLALNLWRNPNPTVNDIVGFDYTHNDGLPYDDYGHGTHTAGTVGAVGGNGVGVSGVNQRISIMAIKFISSKGEGTTADAIRSIDYAVAHGARVLSNSWGGKGDDDNKLLYDCIKRAGAKDVLFVVAAGNDGTDNDGADPVYPASFDLDNILSVAASTPSDKLAFFSNFGQKSTDLAAPGVNVYSTYPGNLYQYSNGTSMAAPHVAGAAALLWSLHPEWTYHKVKQVLMETVDKTPGLEGKLVTGGRLNVGRALVGL